MSKKRTQDNKIPVGILGATGMVGQRFIRLLNGHPWFQVVCVAASSRSAGKNYKRAVARRWVNSHDIPKNAASLKVLDVEKDFKKITSEVNFVFSALNMDKGKIKKLENSYAAKGIPVVSNNSAHRSTEDVPMIIPEVNPDHIKLTCIQRKNRGWDKGFIIVKPNCSLQSYVPPLHALKEFEPTYVVISTYQAISGAGKTFKTWPEMKDNVIPFISGEEKKSEDEPLKIWAELKDGKLHLATKPTISVSCIRVPVSDGHMATVNVAFITKPSREQILEAWDNFDNPLKELDLPSAPKKVITHFKENNRPQTNLDRNLENGMGISVGRLREDTVLDWKFVALSHNTVRGAAGGAILTAELLVSKGYIK